MYDEVGYLKVWVATGMGEGRMTAAGGGRIGIGLGAPPSAVSTPLVGGSGLGRFSLLAALIVTASSVFRLVAVF